MAIRRNLLRKISCLFTFLLVFSFSIPAGFSQETVSLLESEDLPAKQIVFIHGESSRFADQIVEGIKNELNIIAKGKFDDGFTIELACKDLNLIVNLGKTYRMPMTITKVTQEIYEEAKTTGLGSKDHTAIITLLEKLAAIEVRY